MMNLQGMYPIITTQFENGGFVASKTHRAYSSIAIDQAHEQNNRIFKEDGGAVGLTENTSQLM